jgi:hypothetical protein
VPSIQRYLPLEKIEELVHMFTIIKGNEKELKKEIKGLSKNVTARRKHLVKKHGSNSRKWSNEVALKMLNYSKASVFLSVTTTIPAYWGDFLLNYKLANEALKKLKGYRVLIGIRDTPREPRKLVIEYSNGRNKGTIELNELPKEVFKELENVLQVTPIGEENRRAM